MPRSKEGKKRDKLSVENLKQAVNLVQKDGYSVRKAGEICSVPRSTLQRHLNAHIKSGEQEFSYNNNCTVRQVFNEEEENNLQDYLLTASFMNYGLSRTDVKQLAYQFAKCNNKSYPDSWDSHCEAGEQWLSDFRKRNNDLSLRTPRPTSIARATAFNKPVVTKFFELYANLMEKHKFTPDKIYNMDETGVSSVHTPPKVLAAKKMKTVGGVTSAERGFNTTLIGCANAVGNAVPPVFVFPRVNFKQHMLHGAPPGSVGTCFPSGWSTNEIFIQFMDHFINYAKPNKDSKVLLILDNHETHITIDAINKARENGIIMLTIPPHTSHKLQPLDIAVYSPLKNYFNNACKSWHINNPGKPITIYDIAGICGKAYPLAFTPTNILSGFKRAGLWPFNQHIFADHEFCASSVSDRPDPCAGPSLLRVALDEVTPPTGPEIPLVAPDGASPQTALFTEHVEKESTTIFTPQGKCGKIKTPSSLEEIRPFPKAERKLSKKGRKPGRSRILTDTPEKNEIEEAAQNRKNKNTLGKKKNPFLKLKSIDKRKKTKAVLFVEKNTKKRKPEKPVREDTSDDSFASFLSDESEIGVQELIERSNFEQIAEEKEDEIFSGLIQNKVNKWVLVSFKTKTTVKHYVGQIIKVNAGNPIVKFARRVKKTSVFVWPHEDDISEVQEDDIVLFLPQPVVGRRGEISFPVSFSGFIVF